MRRGLRIRQRARCKDPRRGGVGVYREQRSPPDRCKNLRGVGRLGPIEYDQLRHAEQRADQRIGEGLMHAREPLTQQRGVRVRPLRFEIPERGAIVDVARELAVVECEGLVRNERRDALTCNRLNARIVIADEHASARRLDDAGREQRDDRRFLRAMRIGARRARLARGRASPDRRRAPSRDERRVPHA